MGKPFSKELEKVIDTLQWGFDQDVNEIKEEIHNNKTKPLFIVGSGGSLSACNFAALLYQQYGMMAKGITPLELYYSKHTLRQSNVLFISASGKNTDILFGFKTALSYEPNRIYALCMQKQSPLAKLALENSIGKSFEFSLPSGKDGFLATNSLIGFFAILYNSFNSNNINSIDKFKPKTSFFDELNEFINIVDPSYTFTILFAGWGNPVAIDIESKFAEAALADVLMCDYRNFGHGRHHWFAKRKKNSAIIALISPEEEKIAKKTLDILPNDIPVLKIRSEQNFALASIDLLIKSFYLVEQLGRIQQIDPGRPGVPDFGSKLYNLKYSSFYKVPSDKLNEIEKIAIVRKANVPTYDHLNEKEKSYWYESLKNFTEKINKTDFGTIIFDYDGTLCSAENRSTGIEKEVINNLIEILNQGLIIGIATGRGKSVRIDLEKAIPKKYHNQVVMGYYNCSDIGLLSENNLPDKNRSTNTSLSKIYDLLTSYNFPIKVDPEINAYQVTIEIKNKDDWSKVRKSIIQLILSKNIPNIQILESSHSMDIIDQSVTSKLNIIEHCLKLAQIAKLPSNYICIGDKGQWPGNDYQLLSTPFSLSVDEVSPLAESCWNLARPGMKNIKATLFYLSCLTFNKFGFKINIK